MKTTLVGLLAMSSLAAQCMTITDPLVVSVNVKDIKDTYNVTSGTINFDPGCKVKNSADYIDGKFNVSGGGRLVDVIVKANGPYTGNIVGGQVRIGSAPGTVVTLATYSGPWSSFSTPQSLIQNNVTMTLNPGGVNTLLSLVQNQQNVYICHGGAFSSAIGAGNSIDVTIFAQVNATP
jgi:hypothetical protein